MAKLKAGDRVRLSGHPYGCDDEGIYVRKEKDSSCRGKHFVQVSYAGGAPSSTLSFKRRELALIDTPAPAEQEQGEPRIEVGDRVRCTKDYDPGVQFTSGKEYVVRYVGSESIGVVADDGGAENGWSREYFELATEPDWQPKVGDRVRFKTETPELGAVYCDGELTIHRVEDVTKVGVTYPLFGSWTDHHLTQTVAVADLEPLPVAAEAQGADDAPTGALTIQAGRHYRTRDGRKVGPAKVAKYPSDLCRWSLGEFFLYQDDGTCADGDSPSRDLVAEWPSDEVAVAPATATPAAVEHAFKVGDRVRVKEDDREFVVATRNAKGVMSLRSCSGHVGFEWWRDDELLLVDSTIRPGQFATLRVKVTGIHPHGTHANVNIPGLRNPSHGVPLSALTAA